MRRKDKTSKERRTEGHVLILISKRDMNAKTAKDISKERDDDDRNVIPECRRFMSS